ncbi:hypothetical protein FACUT_13856 [Fusarium acutatum]|uniref:Uncharacterized protein n=1 Tax=Fusarium acutatum TaxID=78861 RepID=A0A8H4JB05_9HYPO|nr:hypothetical protein FACUT_13856 [Fusarium acutatum]
MASTEDPMDTSLDTLSPSISLRTHDESPPLTPIPNHADTSLSTHYGTSPPPSPEWSLVSHQHGQQIQSQFDQLSHHQTSATTDNLVEDAADLGAILLSLAIIEQILSPQKQIYSMIKESKDQPLPMFILDKLYQLRSKLHLPDQYLKGETKNLKRYVNELYDVCRKRSEVLVVNVRIETKDPLGPLFAMLARLKFRRPDIGPIDYHCVKKSEFAIILGFFLGSMGCYTDPNYIRTEADMVTIGAAVACGKLEAFIHSL